MDEKSVITLGAKVQSTDGSPGEIPVGSESGD